MCVCVYRTATCFLCPLLSMSNQDGMNYFSDFESCDKNSNFYSKKSVSIKCKRNCLKASYSDIHGNSGQCVSHIFAYIHNAYV